MIATSRMVVSRAICTGTDQTAVCTAKRGMTLGDIMSVMGWMAVGAVWTTGTAPGALFTATHETHWRDITPVTQRLETKYVFQAGLECSVTRVSNFHFWIHWSLQVACLTKW